MGSNRLETNSVKSKKINVSKHSTYIQLALVVNNRISKTMPPEGRSSGVTDTLPEEVGSNQNELGKNPVNPYKKVVSKHGIFR